jgi:predicted  nucleic acid-binding Zn-ribbon protein
MSALLSKTNELCTETKSMTELKVLYEKLNHIKIDIRSIQQKMVEATEEDEKLEDEIFELSEVTSKIPIRLLNIQSQ